jgi:carboxymethylenebutenolidase
MREMTQMIELTAADGHRFAAYVATPKGTPRGALVVVQEIFGVNSHIRSVADGYAEDGYLAIAPAMFDRVERGVDIGYGPEDIQRGMALRQALANDTALRDVAAAIAHLQSVGKVGIVGYCFGGLMAWLAACKLDGLAASVVYYGGGVPDHKDLKPRCPVLLHFGEQDQHIPLPSVEALRAVQPDVSLHTYSANHGFNCDQRPAHEPQSAKLARERTLAFLRQHLG